MSKDLEQLRLNMITSMMELDFDSLIQVKEFMEGQSKIGWKDHINEGNVDFVDYTKLSKITEERKSTTNTDDDKPNIIFL